MTERGQSTEAGALGGQPFRLPLLVHSAPQTALPQSARQLFNCADPYPVVSCRHTAASGETGFLRVPDASRNGCCAESLVPRASDERGFAMLLVFLMAACIAISLYMEIPRVSFESQRAKEELLISRGEQYKRAIKVFVAANKRYPASIEELESFNNHRSLRKRFVDPMTGKKEWRLVHIGPGGMFTDSLVNKQKPNDPNNPNKDKDQQQSTQNLDPNAINPNGTQNSAVPRRRDNEIAALCNGAVPGQTNPGQSTSATPGQTVPGQPPTPTGMPPLPGMPGQGVPGQVNPAGMPPQPGIPGMPGVPNVPGATGSTNPCPAGPLPGQPGYTGQIMPGQPGYVPGQPGMTPTGQVQPGMPGYGSTPYSTVPGAPGTPGSTSFQQPGMNPAMPGTQPGTPVNAQQLIQNLLTQPRQGGFSGQPTQGAGIGGQTIGGGIAGFASTADEEGIKIYNDHSNYKEWEFLYDYTKDTGVVGQQGANGTPANQLGQQPGQNPFGSSTPTQNSPFGATPNSPGQMTSPFGAPPTPPAAPTTPPQ